MFCVLWRWWLHESLHVKILRTVHQKIKSILLYVNVKNKILGKNTLWPRWFLCPFLSFGGQGRGPVCTLLASRMGWGSDPLSDSYTGRFHEQVQSLRAGRPADGQMSTSLDEHLGAWKLLRKYDHFKGPLSPLPSRPSHLLCRRRSSRAS